MTGTKQCAVLEGGKGDMEVDRYLENKAMDYIDHALGRPVDPLGDTYRNYFYVIGDTDLRRQMAQSPHWVSCGLAGDGEQFSVSDEGRAALAAHLNAIGDKNRIFVISWNGYETPIVAETHAKARYQKWLEISDAYQELTFADFQRTSRVRPQPNHPPE